MIGDEKNCTPGTYDFPFSIQLLESLPESLDLYLKQSAHGDDKMLIQYGCKARIGSTKMCQDFCVIAMHHQRRLLQAERCVPYVTWNPKWERGFMHGYVTFATGVNNAKVNVGRDVMLSIKLAGRVLPLVSWRRVLK
jgi:hypothetical protein